MAGRQGLIVRADPRSSSHQRDPPSLILFRRLCRIPPSHHGSSCTAFQTSSHLVLIYTRHLHPNGYFASPLITTQVCARESYAPPPFWSTSIFHSSFFPRLSDSIFPSFITQVLCPFSLSLLLETSARPPIYLQCFKMCNVTRNYYIYSSCRDPGVHYFQTEMDGDRAQACSQGPHERYIVQPGSCPLCNG